MTFDELKNGMKSLFFSLGAKTSDSNYGVALLDKTSGEPKGLMGMSDLASVLGGTVTTYSGNSLDDLKTPGRYTCSSSLLPDGHVGVIDVIEVTGGRYVQTVYQPTVRRTVQRTFNGTSWGNWGNCNGFNCMSAEDLASLLGGQGIARGERVTLQPNGTSRNFNGYGLWCISNEQNDGGAILFTFQYGTNSVTIISDPKSHHGNFWTINKSSAGQTFTITNLQDADCTLWLTNLTPKY